MKGKRNLAASSKALGMVLAFMFATAPGAFAADEQGWYLGLGLGQAKTDIDVAKIENSFSAYTGGAPTTADETDTGWKLFGGYQLTRNWGVELAYVDLGKTSTNTRATTTGVGTDVYRHEYESKGWSIAGVGTAMVSDTFGVFGKLGAFRWDMDSKCSRTSGSVGTGCPAPANRSASGTDLTYGLGLKYNLTEQTGLRLEWEQFKNVGNASTTGSSGTGQADVDLISLGIQYTF